MNEHDAIRPEQTVSPETAPLPSIPEPPVVQPTPPTPSAPPRSGRGLSIAALVVSILALGVALFALWRTFPHTPKPTEPEEVYAEPGTVIEYKGRQLPAFAQVPINTYDSTAFTWQNGRVVYNSPDLRPLVGIDVSYHQQNVDWKQVKASGVDFVMIRVGFRGYGSSGNIMLDSCFEQNIRGALDAGLKVGVYFFSQAVSVWEAEEEAAFVLDAIRGYNVTFPVVFDWERITNASARTDSVTSQQLTLCAGAFCEKIAHAGYTPAIHFNLDLAYLNYDLDKLTDYPFWLAEYRTVPTFFYDFDLWQYSAKGSVPGITGDVDLNLSFVDFSAAK